MNGNPGILKVIDVIAIDGAAAICWDDTGVVSQNKVIDTVFLPSLP